MRRLAAILVLCALAAGAAPPAAASAEGNAARLDLTVRYLQETQNADGGFGEGGESARIPSAWASLALAAAGVNPRCQRRPEGEDAYDYLADGFAQVVAGGAAIATTDFERELMVVNAAGGEPHDFDGLDLVEEIVARALPDGSFAHHPADDEGGVNDTIFAIVALAPIREPAAEAAIGKAAGWLESAQKDDGSWAPIDPDGRGEVDMTGAAIQALNAAGRRDTAAQDEALDYLRGAQGADGGFAEFPGEAESNAASTAWAVQGLWSAGENPEDWLVEGKEPLSYMASLQQPDGRIRWKRGQDLNGTWMTAYAAPAFAGQAWPIPAAPVPEGGCPEPEPPAPEGPAEEGGGFEAAGGANGAIAGGGGRGAPLFSRPKARSRGRTPGAARRVGPDRAVPGHAKSRRGENVEQPAGTATSEAALSERRRPGGGSSGAGKGEDGSGGASGPADGREVEGALIGGGEEPVLGAPGLRGAAADSEAEPWLAAGIGGAVLLLGLMGSRRELLGRLA